MAINNFLKVDWPVHAMTHQTVPTLIVVSRNVDMITHGDNHDDADDADDAARSKEIYEHENEGTCR